MPTTMRTLPAQHLLPDSIAARPASLMPKIIAALAAPLLWLCFFPANQGWCAWFALVPLLILVRSQMSMRAAAFTAWIIGLPLYVATLQWVRVADPMMYYSWIALAFYCSLYFPLAVWLLRRLDRLSGVPLTLALPVVWTALEYLRAHFCGGFAWYFLGHSQHDYLALIQIADLGGVYAVSFLIAAANGLLFESLCRSDRYRRAARIPLPVSRAGLKYQAVIVVLMVIGTLGYGLWRIGQTDFAEGPRVALLQSNIDQGTRNARSNPSQQNHDPVSPSDRMFRELAALTERARREPVDLMIWPETTCPRDWIEIDPSVPTERLPPGVLEAREDSYRTVSEIAHFSRTNVLLGLNCEELTNKPRSERFNSALLVDREGRPHGRYDKMHCVPFGEYVPMRETFPWMRVFTPYESDYSLTPGNHWTRFVLPTERGDFHFGVIICYEDSDPLLARRYALRNTEGEPPVDFLINISNDGWFNGTEEHEQHFAICRFRAIESRRAIARAVNMGISGVIDGNGRVTALSGASWNEAKKVATTVAAVVPIDRRTSVYARAGDWLPAGCAACALLGVLASFRGRKRPAFR